MNDGESNARSRSDDEVGQDCISISSDSGPCGPFERWSIINAGIFCLSGKAQLFEGSDSVIISEEPPRKENLRAALNSTDHDLAVWISKKLEDSVEVEPCGQRKLDVSAGTRVLTRPLIPTAGACMIITSVFEDQ